MPQLEQAIKAMKESLNPYGLYLQRRPTEFPVSIAKTNGQNFNFEPYIALIVVFALSEFCKGFLGKLGGALAEYLSEERKQGKAPEQIDIQDLTREVEKELRLAARSRLTTADSCAATNCGLKHVQVYLIGSGLPEYVADEIVSQWQTTLLPLLDSLDD